MDSAPSCREPSADAVACAAFSSGGCPSASRPSNCSTDTTKASASLRRNRGDPAVGAAGMQSDTSLSQAIDQLRAIRHRAYLGAQATLAEEPIRQDREWSGRADQSLTHRTSRNEKV